MSILLKEFRPEVLESEYFSEKDIIFLSCLGPFIEGVQDLDMTGEMVQRFHLRRRSTELKTLTAKTPADIAYKPLFQL